MNIIEILKTKILPESTTSRLDVELLLSEVLHKPRSFLYTAPEYVLTQDEEKVFQELYQRRLLGEPIAYILGRKEFWKLEFTVNNSVLIPRPETELLVEIILNKLDYKSAHIADLGTGSGVIAITLAKERPRWNVIATDISQDALQIAKYNAMRLQVPNVKFYCGDWCNILPDIKFDTIVSNPPYIANSEPHLSQGDVKFEPRIALEIGDGLNAIRDIIIQAKTKLKPNGFLVLEHGYNQSREVQDLLQKNGYETIIPYQDLSHIYRAVVAEI